MVEMIEGREQHTDVVVFLKKHFNKLTYIRVFQFLHDADFSSKGVISRSMAMVSIVSNVFTFLYHFDGIPYPSGTSHSLPDSGKGSFTQFDAEVVMYIEAFRWWTARCMTIHKA